MIPDIWHLLVRAIVSDVVVLTVFLVTAGCGVFAMLAALSELVARITVGRIPTLPIATTPEENAALYLRRLDAYAWLEERNTLLFGQDLPAMLRRQAGHVA